MRVGIALFCALLLSACGGSGESGIADVVDPVDGSGSPVDIELFRVELQVPKKTCVLPDEVPKAVGTVLVRRDASLVGTDAQYEVTSTDGILMATQPTGAFTVQTTISLQVTRADWDVAVAELKLTAGDVEENRLLIVYNACGPAGTKLLEIFDEIGINKNIDQILPFFVRTAYLQEVKNAAGTESLTPPPDGEIVATYADRITTSFLNPLFLPALFPTGSEQAAFGSLAPGLLDQFVFHMTLAEAIPLDNDEDSLAYYFAFNANDDAGDDFIADVTQPCDPFTGTDRVLRLAKEPGENWRLDVFGTDPAFGEGFFPFLTDAAGVINCNTITLFIPTREIPRPQPLFRAISLINRAGIQFIDAEPRADKPKLELGTPDQVVGD